MEYFFGMYVFGSGRKNAGMWEEVSPCWGSPKKSTLKKVPSGERLDEG